MKMKIISIVVSSIIFISSSIVGYNIYKDTESKKAESLKTETAQVSATQTENDTEEKADKEELEENKVENQEEVKENKEETKDVQENKKDNTEKETSSGKITEKVNNNEKVSVSQNDQSKNNEQNTKTNVDNKQNQEQNKSVSKFTVYRCGANVASKDDMFYNDEFGYPIGMVGSEDIWMYYIDFNLDKKTAETGNEVNGKKSVLTTIKLTDSQVEKLRKIYQGSGDSEIPSGIYYEVNSEEYEKDCRIVIVTNKSDIDFLNELVSKYWKESTIVCK